MVEASAVRKAVSVLALRIARGRPSGVRSVMEPLGVAGSSGESVGLVDLAVGVCALGDDGPAKRVVEGDEARELDLDTASAMDDLLDGAGDA